MAVWPHTWVGLGWGRDVLVGVLVRDVGWGGSYYLTCRQPGGVAPTWTVTHLGRTKGDHATTIHKNVENSHCLRMEGEEEEFEAT